MHTFICKLWSIWGKNKTVQGEINLHCPKKKQGKSKPIKKTAHLNASQFTDDRSD